MISRIRRFLTPPDDLDPQQGIFLVLCRVGAVLSLAVVIPVNLVQDLPRVINVLVGLFGLFCIWLHRQAARGRYHDVAFMLVLGLLLDLVYFPNAGSIGSVLFYAFPQMLLPLIFLRGRPKYIGVTLVMANWSVLLLVEGLAPGLVRPFQHPFDRLLDMWTGLMVSGLAVAVIATAVLSWYHRERARLKATVAELDASRDQLAELFRQHADAVLVIDPESRKVLQVNDKFIRLSGVSAEEIVGRTTRDFNLWRHQSDRDRFYEQLVADGRVRDFVAEFHTVTGVRQWGSVSAGYVTIGGRQRLLTTARDITAEQAAAAAAAESAALLQAVVNSSDEIVSVVDPVTHRTLLYNQTSEHYFRTTYGLELRVGMLPEDVLPSDTAARWHAMYERAMASGPFTVDYTTAAGRVLLLSFSPVMYQGKACGISMFGRDITDIRRAEQMQARLERQLIEAQKMESLGSLAGGVAHDFNNMLDGIMGHAELMSDAETDPVKRMRIAAIIRAATRSSELTRKLLAFARRGKNIVESVRLADLVGDGLTMVQPTLAKDVDVRLDLRDTWSVDGDPAQLNQVIVNLCINAAEAMAGGGTLTVATADRVLDAQQGASVGVAAGDYVELRVSDTGAGMTEELQRRIFEPFFTTKVEGRSSGTGLGLATVYGVLQLHRGGVQVQSALGQGTTFLVWLPKGILPPKPVATLPATPVGRGLVLIVDDEELLRSLHADMVQALGYDAVVAADGAEGVNVFRARHRDLAAVLLDLKMPTLDGAQAFHVMREINPDVPVILCSGFGDNEEAQGLITKGARGLLAKPFRLADLAAQLQGRTSARA